MKQTSATRHPTREEDAQEVLRRVVRLVAHEADGQLVFDSVIEGLGRSVDADAAWLVHFDPDGFITMVGVWSTRELSLPVGTRQAVSQELRALRDRGQSYRFDLAGSDRESSFTEEARRLGIASAVGVPVWLAGQVWALAVVARFGPEQFVDSTEARMTRFIEPVTAALASAWTGSKFEEWHAEQAGLRRLARSVAAGLRTDELLQAAVAEVSALVGGRAVVLARLADDRSQGVVVAASNQHIPIGLRFSTDGDGAAARALRSGRPERADDGPATAGLAADELGGRAAVAAPVVVEGHLWGVLAAVSSDEPLPAGTEGRLSRCAEVVVTALSIGETREELERLAREQAALLRVSQLVARGAGEAELFEAVAVEAAGLQDVRGISLARLDGPRSFAVVAGCGGPADVGLAFEVPVEDPGPAAEVLRTQRPARRDDYPLSTAVGFTRWGDRIRSIVSVPIIVEGRFWGLLSSVGEGRQLPAGTEGRLQQFGELIAAWIGNHQARTQVQALADEQSALLRVAELVARGVSERDLFEAVAAEAAALMEDGATTLVRHDGDETFTVLATCGGAAPFGTVLSLPSDDLSTLSETLRTGLAARLDDDAGSRGQSARRADDGIGPRTPVQGVRSSVSVPIVVEGQLWGCISIVTQGRRLAANTAGRLQKFGELIAAAIANSQARTEVVQLADEQAALRRVADLVAREASLPEVLAGIAVEASRLLSVGSALLRFDADGYAEIVAAHAGRAEVGLRIPTTDSYIGQMFTAGQAVRLADYREAGFAAAVEDLGVEPGTAVPIIVEDKIWGALKTSPSGAVLRPGARRDVVSTVAEKLEKFAALAAAAIANAENRAQLTASRARIVATADEARRQLQRNVHDGAQQRLVQTVLTLKLARDVAGSGGLADDLVEEALTHAERATAELRDLVHGILPASLDRGGLRSGLQSLIADLPIPVELNFAAPRLPGSTEITAYFVVAEALANVVKHASATHAVVGVEMQGERVAIEVRDDGVGGADAGRGSGLTGLLDRVETAEGELGISSPPGGGTTLRVTLPVTWP